MALQQEEQQAIIDNIINSFEDDINLILLDVDKIINDIILEQGLNSTTALNFETSFIQALDEAGYYAKVNDLIDNKFDELFKTIRQGIIEGGFNVVYTSDDLAKIAALKQLQLDQFNNLGNDAGQALQQNLYKYVLSDFRLSDVQRQLKEDLAGTDLSKYSTTLARTAIGDFQQSVIDIKSEGLDGVWLYVGVKDKKNRDYCRCVLDQNHYYTKDQINLIMNDKARRFNCRHRARIVSVEYAQDNNFTPTKTLKCGS